MKDSLGDRMKYCEGLEANRMFMPGLPIIARMDGRSFHNFTKGMERPFCENLSICFKNTLIKLIEETGACIGYTQSDEITLVWRPLNFGEQMWFNGRISKMTSQLAALTTLYFFTEVQKHLPEYADRLPSFDARAWQVPSEEEAISCLVWREWDATKNSISMAASHYYPESELLGKNSSDRQEMLFQKGINWNNYLNHFKRGSYAKRIILRDKFSLEEIEKLPPKHSARLNPDLEVTRSRVVILDLPPITRIGNAIDVVFRDAEPILKTDQLVDDY